MAQADNRFNHTTAPMHTGGDFWHYGGLTRSVELHTLSEKDAVLWRAYVRLFFYATGSPLLRHSFRPHLIRTY